MNKALGRFIKIPPQVTDQARSIVDDSLDNHMLIVQKIRVGVPAETQNEVITNSTDAQKKVL